MADSSGSYNLKVEFLDTNQPIDEEDEFRNFCMNIWEPGATDTSPGSFGGMTTMGDQSAGPVATNAAVNDFYPPAPVTIKRVKPSYVQTLRPASAQVHDDDVRISYARTIFNTMNGFEKEEIGRKLPAFCEEDCVMTVKWIGERGNPCGPSYREVRGLNSVITFLEAILVTAVPDAVMQLQDSKLRVKPDKSSYLLCKYTFSGTQVTKIEPIRAPMVIDFNNLGGMLQAGALNAGSGNNGSAGVGLGMSAVGEHAAKRLCKEESADHDAAANFGTAGSAHPPPHVSSNASVSSSGSGDSHNGQNLNHPSNHNGKGKGKRELEPGIDPSNIIEGLPMAGTSLLPKMVKMNVVGTLIIHINAANRIYRFEYIQKVVRLV